MYCPVFFTSELIVGIDVFILVFFSHIIAGGDSPNVGEPYWGGVLASLGSHNSNDSLEVQVSD